MSDKKVVHLTSVHQRYDTRIFVKECCSLVKNDYLVSLIVADGKGNEKKSDVSIFDVGRATHRADRVLRVTNRIFLKAMSLNADVYHIHDPELILVGYRLKKQGKVVIFDAHEDVVKQIISKPYLPVGIRFIVSKAYSLIEKILCEKFDTIVAATPYIRDRFLKIGAKSLDINNYPLLSEFDTSFEWNEKKRQVCYIGGLTQVRGIREIVTAIDQSSQDSTLVIGGDFTEEDFKAEMLTKFDDSNVIYKGWLSRNEVTSVLKSSMAGLVTLHPIPNYLDALPVKMFEYMASGIPVIASDFELWRGIIESSRCGVCVDPFDSKAIANAIDKILDNPELSKEMGMNGRQAVKDKYNWTIEEQKLLKLYSELTALSYN